MYAWQHGSMAAFTRADENHTNCPWCGILVHAYTVHVHLHRDDERHYQGWQVDQYEPKVDKNHETMCIQRVESCVCSTGVETKGVDGEACQPVGGKRVRREHITNRASYVLDIFGGSSCEKGAF